MGERRASEFSDAVLGEIDVAMGALGIKRFETVYVGGGSPNSLVLRTLEKMIGGIAKRAASFDEFTVELNPEFVSRDQLTMLASLGVTRASLGVQSLSDEVLRASGRKADRVQSLLAIDTLEKYWRGRLSADLIAGLPAQRQGDMKSAIATLTSAGFGHISLYELSVEEGSPLATAIKDGSLRIPSDDERWTLWDEGVEALEGFGLMQYEVSNFCVSGQECIHNVRYWELESYVGCGPAAVGTIEAGYFGLEPFIEPGAAALRLSHTPDLDSYLGAPSRYNGRESLDRSTWAKDGLIMGMRLARGISRERFEGKFGMNLDRLIGKSAKTWKNRGLLVDDAKGIRLTKEGLRYLNAFLIDCLLEIDEAAKAS